MEYVYYIAALILGGIITLFIKSFFPSYMNEKGKNLATKEDINEITKIVEQIKSDFSKDLEFLKWELSKKANLHRLVAEKEIAAISEIGESLFDLRAATHNLRPILDYAPPEGQTIKERHKERYGNWVDKHNGFLGKIEKHRLFLPKHIFDKFEKVRSLAAKEAWSFEFSIDDSDRTKKEIREEARENLKVFKKSIDEAAELIHQRYEIEGLNLPLIRSEKSSMT